MRATILDNDEGFEICLAGTTQFNDETNTISYATFNILTGHAEVREETIENDVEYFKRKLEGE